MGMEQVGESTLLGLEALRAFGSHEKAAEYFGVTEADIREWETEMVLPSWAIDKAMVGMGKVIADKSHDPIWDGRKLTFLLPWYKTTNPLTTFALLALFDRTKMRVEQDIGDAMIVRTRNKLATRFMATDSEWSLWVDDDMIPPIGNPQWFTSKTGIPGSHEFTGINSINRLVSHGKTLIGAMYFQRGPKGRACYAEAFMNEAEDNEAHRAPKNKIKPTEWVGTGFLLVHRSVYSDIEKKFPNLAPKSATEPWNYFTPDADNHGEDVTFCKRAKLAGHQPYVDFGVVCGHIGGAIYGPQNTR